jgi:signal transduction histidine kinase
LKADPAANPEREDIAILLFQSVRELLFNVVKHAGVKSARLEMTRDESNRLIVTVSDRGVGFEPGAETGFGLLSIQERLGNLGGTLRCTSAPGKGSSFSLILPVQAAGAGIETGSADGIPV